MAKTKTSRKTDSIAIWIRLAIYCMSDPAAQCQDYISASMANARLPETFNSCPVAERRKFWENHLVAQLPLSTKRMVPEMVHSSLFDAFTDIALWVADFRVPDNYAQKSSELRGQAWLDVLHEALFLLKAAPQPLGLCGIDLTHQSRAPALWKNVLKADSSASSRNP